MIEAPDDLPPGTLADLLESRLPKPVEDEAAWYGEPDDGEDDADEDDEAPASPTTMTSRRTSRRPTS